MNNSRTMAAGTPIGDPIRTWLDGMGAVETARRVDHPRDGLYDDVCLSAVEDPTIGKLLRTTAYNLREGHRQGRIRIDGQGTTTPLVQSIAQRFTNVGLFSSWRIARKPHEMLEFTVNLRDETVASEVIAISTGELFERAARRMARAVFGDTASIASNVEGTIDGNTFELDVVAITRDGTPWIVEAKAPRQATRGMPRFRVVCEALAVPLSQATMFSPGVPAADASEAKTFHEIAIVDAAGLRDFLTDARDQGTTAHIDDGAAPSPAHEVPTRPHVAPAAMSTIAPATMITATAQAPVTVPATPLGQNTGPFRSLRQIGFRRRAARGCQSGS